MGPWSAWCAAAVLAAGGSRGADEVPAVVEARAEVRNGAAGHDAVEARFATSVDGEAVRHLLTVENGCGPEGPRCTGRPVAALTITLNEATVFSGAGPATGERLEVALNPRGGAPNHLVVRSGGEPGSRARVLVSSLGRPLQPLGGRAVLADADPATVLVVHDAGTAPLGYRLVFYRPDGSEAGRAPARRLEPRASEAVPLADAASGLGWRGGPVHVLWASRGETHLAASASQRPGGARVALDLLEARPVSDAELQARTGGLAP
jgi:hypothetical protein